MKTGNIGIRSLADIGVGDIDVYGSERRTKNGVNFRGNVQFFRSREQSEGKLGLEDVSYTGQFGFDSFNKEHCPRGSVIYYLDKDGKAIENKNYSGYVSPYLSIWPPKVDKEKSSVILYVKASDNSGVPELLEYECKEWNKESKSFSTLSKNLNIQKLKTDNFGGKNYYKINVQCTESFENDISIIAKYSGNDVGRIIVKANAQVYETIIQPVLVSFGNSASSRIEKKDHEKFITDLVVYFNKQSFNQSYIRGKLANKTHQVTFLKSDFMKDEVVKEISDEEDGCGNVCKGGLFINYSEDNLANAFRYNHLVEQRYAAYDSGNKEKQQAKEELEEGMTKLLNEFKKEFKYSDTSDLSKAKKFCDDKKITNIWNSIKVQEAYNNYKTLKEKYSGDVVLDKINKIYFFINNDIEGAHEPKNKAQAYSLPESGIGHIFASAYTDKDANSLIIHELGHSFGLKHTFEDSIEGKLKENNNFIKGLEEEKKELNKIKKNYQLKNYFSLDKKYLIIQKLITYYEKNGLPTVSYFEKAFLLHLVGSCSFYEDNILKSKTTTSIIKIENTISPTSDILVDDEISLREQKIEILKKENLDLNKKIGIVITRSMTLENFMDYRQPPEVTCDKKFNEKFQYKSFYQNQWSKMKEIGIENKYLCEIK